MQKRTKNKAQGALEYLMTYGWALLLLVTTVSFLYFAGAGGLSRNSCQVNFTFLCKGVYTDKETILLNMQNGTSRRIIINPFEGIAFDSQEGYGTVKYSGQTYKYDDVTIPSGATFQIEGKGMSAAKNASVTYIEQDTGSKKTVSINLTTDTPKNAEMPNDGIDNDKDGFKDCQDPSVLGAGCEYILKPAAVPPNTITTATPATIYYGYIQPVGATESMPDTTVATETLVFFVETITGTPTGYAHGFGTNSASQTIKLGWNAMTISSDFEVAYGTYVGNLQLIAQTGSFTINTTEKTPRLILNVDRP